MENGQIHHRACNLCEAICGLEISHEAGTVARVVGDKADPLSHGAICPKGARIGDLYADPDRLRQPLVRKDGVLVPATWEQAFKAAAKGLRAVRERHGASGIGVYLGNPTVHNLGSMSFSHDLVRAIGTKNLFTPTSMDQLPHHFAAQFMFGHPMRIPVPDLDRTQFLLILGANPMVSNGSLTTAPGFARRLKRIEDRGGTWVVLDPRRTETARRAPSHHFITPGSDVFFLLAMLRTIFETGATLGRLATHVRGLEALRQVVQPFSPEAVAGKTGISAEVLRELTRSFLESDGASVYGRMGACTQAHGGLNLWLINAINLVSGNLDRAGGAMFPSPAIETVRGEKGKVRYGRWRSRVSGRPEFFGELPVSTLAEEMLTPGEGQVRGMVTVCGNPALAVAGSSDIQRGLAGLDFLVCVDIYLNETTQHADVILPPTTGLEIDHYDLAFHCFAVRNTARFSTPMYPPDPSQKPDWEILKRLVRDLSRKRLGLGFRFKTPRRMVNMGLMTGPYGRLHPRRLRTGLSLKRLLDSPHGVDLGPLVPRLPEALWTSHGQVELSPQVFLDGMPAVTSQLAACAPTDTEMRLIGRRNLRSNNTWMHNLPKLMRGPSRCTALVHPTDGERLGVAQGETIRVSSRVGSFVIPVELTDEVMPGVLCVPHGYGHGETSGLRVAQAHAGVNVNEVLDASVVDPVSGNLALSGQPVEVTREAQA